MTNNDVNYLYSLLERRTPHDSELDIYLELEVHEDKVLVAYFLRGNQGEPATDLEKREYGKEYYTGQNTVADLFQIIQVDIQWLNCKCISIFETIRDWRFH